jgi:hypothetical protein
VVALLPDDQELSVSLSLWERAAALRRSFAVPLSSVKAVVTLDKPWSALKGWRAPGTGLPGVIMYGTLRREGLRDFVAVLGKRPGVCVELDPEAAGYARIVACVDDPRYTADSIRAAAGI